MVIISIAIRCHLIIKYRFLIHIYLALLIGGYRHVLTNIIHIIYTQLSLLIEAFLCVVYSMCSKYKYSRNAYIDPYTPYPRTSNTLRRPSSLGLLITCSFQISPYIKNFAKKYFTSILLLWD